MESAEIKVIFLDIGGVLLSNGWEDESRRKAAERFHLDYSEMEKLHHSIFNLFEIGHLTMEEYLDTVIFHQSRDFTKEEFKTFMFSQSTELPQMLQWIKVWKKDCGFRIISLNNEGRELNEFRIKKFGLHVCFDAFVSSCVVGLQKPDPSIFHLAMGIGQVSPRECIYIDDRLMLVLAARKLGIQSFQHVNFASTKELLEGLKAEKRRMNTI